MATVAVTGRHDLTDAQWAILEPLLPVGRRPGRPPTWTKRQLIDGIRWRTRVGAPWRDVPQRYGSWSAVFALTPPGGASTGPGQPQLRLAAPNRLWVADATRIP